MSIDPNADLVLRWEFDPSDIRKVKMYIPNPDGSPEPLKLFTFSTYERMSTYYRFNLMTGRYENAGDIEWNSVYNIKLNMGIRSLHVEQMARRNKASSRSRRFKAMNGVEYKWRPVEDKPENLEVGAATWSRIVESCD
ncbi:hypothetical protein FRB99_005050 [Tulasnella sp. 403]|nr:hypothetical protein FRB99_005050 [Tulasnella sp. 403]